MADWERLLVSKAAQTGNVEALIATGVDERHFADDAAKAVWQALVDHTQKYRQSPSLTVAKDLCVKVGGDFRFEVVTDSTAYITEHFLNAAKTRAAIEAMRDIARAIDSEDSATISRIDEVFLEKARELSMLVPSTTVDRYSLAERRIKRYHEARFSGRPPRGIPYGIHRLDEATMGIQPHEYITFSAWSGVGKSTLTLHVLFSAYLHGYTPMLFSLEMDTEAIMRKFDTLATHFRYSALKRLELGEKDVVKWEKMAERAANATNDIIVIDSGSCTVERVYAELNRYKPDLCAIDYVSLMDHRPGVAHWEGVTMTTKGLKATARDMKIPIIGVAQSNDEVTTAQSMAHSKSIFRDSDIVLALMQDDDMMAASKMELKLIKNRDGRLMTQDMYWDVDTMTMEPWADTMPFTKPPAQEIQ